MGSSVSPTARADTLDAPGNFRVSARSSTDQADTSGSITVAWDAVTGDHRGYQVSYRTTTTDNSGTWTFGNVETSTSSTLANLPHSPTTTYDIRVATCHTGTDGACDHYSGLLTNIAVINNLAPPDIRSTAQTTDSITLAWDEPVDSELVTTYFYRYRLASESAYGTPTAASASPVIIGDLTAGDTYDIEVCPSSSRFALIGCRQNWHPLIGVTTTSAATAGPQVSLELTFAGILSLKEDPDATNAERTATLTATLSEAASEDVTVTVSAAGPVSLSDTELVIPSGETSSDVSGSSKRSITVTAENDEIADGSDLVTISGTVTPATITAPADVTTHVLEDDRAGLVFVTPLSIDDDLTQVRVAETDDPSTTNVEENVDTYTVALASKPTADVTVTLSQNRFAVGVFTVDTDPDTDDDQNTLTFTPDNWNLPQDVYVTAIDNDRAGDLGGYVNHAATGGNYDIRGSHGYTVSVSVTNDDVRGITTDPSPLAAVTLAEADDPATTAVAENASSYTIVLDTDPTENVTVTIQSGDTDVATVNPGAVDLHRRGQRQLGHATDRDHLRR